MWPAVRQASGERATYGEELVWKDIVVLWKLVHLWPGRKPFNTKQSWDFIGVTEWIFDSFLYVLQHLLP